MENSYCTIINLLVSCVENSKVDADELKKARFLLSTELDKRSVGKFTLTRRNACYLSCMGFTTRLATMSRTRVYKQATLDIQQRFFDVMQELSDEKRLPGGLAGYCETYDVDRRHYSAQKNDLNKGYFEVAWLLR